MRHYELFNKESKRFYDRTLQLVNEYETAGRSSGEAYVLALTEGHSGATTAREKFGWASACNRALLLKACNEVGGEFSFNKMMSSQAAVAALQSMMVLLEESSIPGAWSYIAQGVRYAYHVLLHERSGFKNYKVSEDLALELYHTELKGLQCGDFYLPFQSVYVDAPQDLNLKIWNDMTGWHRLSGAYLAEDPNCYDSHEGVVYYKNLVSIDRDSFRKGRAIHFLLWGLPNDGEDPLIDDATLSFTVVMDDDGALLDDRVQEVFRKHHLAKHEEWLEVVRWLTNVMVYATWPQANSQLTWMDPRAARLWQQTQSGPKSRRKKLLRKLKEHHQGGQVYYLGGDIVVDRKKSAGPGGKTGKSWTLDHRVPVAGHWRHYWLLQGRSRAKVPELFRIRPHWRGPEDAPVSNKERRLK